MAVEKAISYDTTSDSEEREEFRRGGRGGRGGRGRGGGGRGRGGGRRGGGSRGRGRSSRGSRGPGRGSGSSRGKSKGKSKGRGRSSARGASAKGAQSRSAARSRSARSASRSAQRSATKSQAASRAKSKANEAAASNREAGRLKSQASAGTKAQRKNTSGTRYSGKLAGAMRRANAPKATSISAEDKNKIRNPSKFSPQDVAAALGRKSLAEAAAGKFKSRNEAYKANQAAVDAQKSRFDGYSPSARSDTSAIAGYGGINPKNMGLGVQAAFNRAQDRNETTGMGLLDSARFQTTRPEFKNDIDNLKAIAGSIPTPMNLARKMAMGILNPDGTAVAAAPEETGGIMAGLKNMLAMRPDADLERQRQAQQRDGGRGYQTPPPIPVVPPSVPPNVGIPELENDPRIPQPAIPSFMKLAGYGDDEARELMKMYNPGSTFTI